METFVPKKNKKPEKPAKPQNDGEINKSSEIETNTLSSEEATLLIKSRKILEQKSKFYEKMTKTGGSLNSDDNCLVMFNQKQQAQKPEHTEVIDSSSDEDDDDDIIGPFPNQESSDPNEQWVEYVDCLGRSRKCLKRDLELFKKKDEALSVDLPPNFEGKKVNLSSLVYFFFFLSRTIRLINWIVYYYLFYDNLSTNI